MINCFKIKLKKQPNSGNYNILYQFIDLQCLPPGCNCDPDAADPDGFCMPGEVCKVNYDMVGAILLYFEEKIMLIE